MRYHQLSGNLDSFSDSGFDKNGLKRKMVTAVLSFGEEQSHNSDDRVAESEKVRKAKKILKINSREEEW